MRPIKFRGKDADGNLCFGSLIVDDRQEQKKYNIVECRGSCQTWLIWAEVDPESVAQLVGYDKDGKEVYEGDAITYLIEEKVKVRLSGETETCSYLGIAGDKFYDCKLKK